MAVMTPDKPKLWRPKLPFLRPLKKKAPAPQIIDPTDPLVLGYDRQLYNGGAIVTQETDNLDYATAGTDSIDLSKDRVITGIMLVADPYRHDVSTAAITVVQDAVDKVLSGLTIAGGPTYFQLSSTLAFLKALSAMNKLVYGGTITHEDLATAVGGDNDSIQGWYIPFGILNDFDPFDASAGIPAEDENSLVLRATFGANNLIAETAANGTVDAATDLFALTYGVQGLPSSYRQRLPIPDFRHDHITSPETNSRFNLEPNRYLKRTTILNLAVAANNNEPRNDGNITDITVEFTKPTLTRLVDQVRWEVFKQGLQFAYRGIEVDRDGSAAISTSGLDGVAVIDWRRWTHNPFGLNLYGISRGDVALRLTMGTTTGSIHIFNEYYSLPDPSVADLWQNNAFRPQ